MQSKAPQQLNALCQLKPGNQVESIVTGARFVILANYGSRVLGVESITLVTVNDHAYKEWFCASSDKPLNQLKVGDVITNKQTYVITHVSDYILHANRCIEITHPREYLLIN